MALAHPPSPTQQRNAFLQKECVRCFFDANTTESYAVDGLALPQKAWSFDDASSAISSVFTVPERNLSILAPSSSHTCLIRRQTAAVLEPFFETLAGSFDLLIVDAPGVLEPADSGPDAISLAEWCDAVFLVVETAVTPIAKIDAARNRFHSREIALAGAILDDAAFPPLKNELLRQAAKIDQFAPRTSRWLANTIRSARVLDVDY